jgi:hypothetical protein
MRIGSVLRRGSAARITGSAIAAAGMTFIGLGTAGIGTITGGASSPNHCTAAEALAKGVPSVVISTDPGTCDVSGNSTTLPALGYVTFDLSSGGTTTVQDILQSVGNDHDYFVGTYTVSFSNVVDQTNAANTVSTTSGTYALAAGTDEGETGDLASTFPTEPSVTGTLPTISGTAGDEVTAAYEVQFTASGPQESYSSEKNDVFFNRGATQETQAASEAVKLLGIDSTTSSTTSSTPTTSSTVNSSNTTNASAPTTSSTSSDTGTTSSNDPTVSTSSDTTGSSSATSSAAPITTSSSTSSPTATTTSSSTTSTAPPTTSSSSASNAPTTTSSSTNSAAPTTTARGDPPASTTTGSSSAGASTSHPASSSDPSAVLGNGTSTPSTGADIQFGAGLALLTLGAGLIFGSSRRTRRTRP